MMILMSMAQEFAYTAEQVNSGWSVPSWVNLAVAGVCLFFVIAGAAAGESVAAGAAAVFFVLNLFTGLDNLEEERQESPSARSNVVAIQDDYGVEVLSISEPEKSDGLDTQKALLDVRIGMDTVSCTQYIKTEESVYSVYCGEGSTQSPLETLTR